MIIEKEKMKIIKSFEEIVVKIEITVLVIFLSVMVLLAFLQVVLRNVFSAGFLWADTLLRYMVLWVGFLGASISTKEERHINVDALTRFLSPYIKNLFSIITSLFAAVVCYYMLTASIKFLKVGIPEGVILFENIPILYFLIIIPAGFALMVFHFLIRIIIKIDSAFHRKILYGSSPDRHIMEDK
jgi:TRAP-type C4-dicarboxylate transport system permease small subunit